MAETVRAHPMKTVAAWARVVRPFSFTASAIPVPVAALLALHAELPVRWALLGPVVLGVVLTHAATNLVSEASDFRKGLDRAGKLGGSGVLVEGLLAPGPVFAAGVGALLLAGLIALALVWAGGLGVLWFALAGAGGGFFYGAPKFGYKYHALGDPMVFMLMGPLLVLGSHFVLAGQAGWTVLAASLPVGCLVTAILCANNIRDIAHDTQAGVRTLATVLGGRAARVEYLMLVSGAYLVVVVLSAWGVLPLTCLLVLLSAPAARSCLRTVLPPRPEGDPALAGADVRTAQLHLLFNVLLCAGLVLGWALSL